MLNRKNEIEEMKFQLQKLEFEKSLEQRNFEIDNFWKRGWFFGALLLAIAAGYSNFDKVSKANTNDARICLAFLGAVVSFFQSLMNRGSKYWQERWENKTKNKEAILGIDLTRSRSYQRKEKYLADITILAKNENFFTMSRRFSVSKLTILVWDILTLSWLILCIRDLPFLPDIWPFNSVFTFHFVLIIYIFFFFRLKRKSSDSTAIKWYDFFNKYGGGKVYERFTKSPKDDSYKNDADQRYYKHSEYYVENKENEIRYDVF